MTTSTSNGGESAKSAAPAGTKQLRNSSNPRPIDNGRKQNGSPVDGQGRKQYTPKAWQGPNPITSQRPSTSTTNGIDKPLPRIPQESQQAKSSGDLHADRHAHDRTLFLLAHFVGKDAAITLKNGEQFSGVFSGGSFEATKCQYALKMAKRTKAPSHQQTNGAVDSLGEHVGHGDDRALLIDAQDTLHLSVLDVTIRPTDPKPNGSAGSFFLTDTQISGRDPHMSRERELQRWEPGPDAAVDLSLDNSKGAEWDQFAVNERMYGVQTTYDESVYTTPLDRNNPLFKQRQAEADRIAREIEGSAAMNPHIAEERRRDAPRENGGDEEDKYSGVRRELPSLPKRAVGSYIPPSQRPITGTPTVPGAPFDPAIISTKVAKFIVQPPKGSEATADAPQMSPVAPSVTGSAIPALAAVEQRRQQSAATQRSQQIPESASQAAAPKKPTEVTTEDHVRGTADAFKQFANNEKLRIRVAREKDLEAKRANVKREQNVKLNDLKKFAANFRLTSRVPDDLVPILAKDREKQIEIQNKAEAVAKEEEQKSKQRASDPQISSPQQRYELQPNTHSSFPTAQRLPAQVKAATPASFAKQRSPLPGEQTPRPNLNAKAFEFRPSASTLSTASPSPHIPRPSSGKTVAAPVPFFDNGLPKQLPSSISAFNPIKKLSEVEFRSNFAVNGNFPQAYHTPPTWSTPENSSVRIEQLFPASLPILPEPSQMHPQFHGSPMTHIHQGTPSPYSSTPASMHPRPYYGQQQQPPPHMQPQFIPHMPQHQQHMPQYRGSPNPSFRQVYPPQQHGYPGMPPPQFHSQPPPLMQPPFQGPPFSGPGPNMMQPYRSPNMSYRVPGGAPPHFPAMGGQGYR